MDYEKLTTDQRKQMLDQRLAQYEQEHYNHAVNLSLLEATGATDEGTEQAKKAAREAMATLDEAHANTKTERATLDA